VPVLVVGLPSSEIPKDLTNYPISTQYMSGLYISTRSRNSLNIRAVTANAAFSYKHLKCIAMYLVKRSAGNV
jgi:hypothetical protein